MDTNKTAGAGSSLIAILLVTRSRPGPKIVFLCPSSPERLSTRHTVGEDGLKSNDDSDSDSDVDINGIAHLRRSHQPKVSQDNAHHSRMTESDPATADHILGYAPDSLDKLLAPGLWSNKKKFEVCLDGLTFVGHPVHAHEDGKWTRKDTMGPTKAASEPEDRYGDYTNFGFTLTEPLSPVRTARNDGQVSESFDTDLGRSLGTSMNSASSTSTTTAEQVTMFNVVFAFDSADGQIGQKDVAEMYRHIVKPFSKALHYCQKHTNYVAAESRRLLSLQARAKQHDLSRAALHQQSFETSELAWALQEVYDSMTTGRVAGIRLNGQAISLQTSPIESRTSHASELSPNVGLLLLDEKGTLLRELSHPDASPLAQFIHEHTPTKTLAKLSARLGMSISETLFLAGHLIKWNKARPITPLHPRNTYIVQPSAPTERLPDLMNDYARRYPALPSLPQMLRILSGKPLRYGVLIPSRDHSAAYLDVLGYLIQHDFVRQLQSYAWLRKISRRKRPAKAEVEVNQNRLPLSVASLLSPQLRAVDDDSESISSERTAIPLAGAERRQADAPTSTPSTEVKGDDETSLDTWDIITNPLDPSPEEAEALANIAEALPDAELAERLPSLLKYFTGDLALEGMAASEGFKRSQVERWIDLLQREELMVMVRHL